MIFRSNQYHVIMEVAPYLARDPSALRDVYVPAGTSGTTQTATATTRDPSTGSALTRAPRNMVPLSAIARHADGSTPTAINHQDMAISTTISFNTAEGFSLSDAQQAIARAEAAIRMPTTLRGSFQGTARVFQESLRDQPLLILADRKSTRLNSSHT